VAFVFLAAVTYLAVTFLAPRNGNSNQYHLSVTLIILITVTVLGLWMATCFSGLYAWLELDRYANMQAKDSDQKALHQLASGVRFLAYGLLISSIFSASGAYFAAGTTWSVLMSQLNYYIILLAPFLGFLWLREGSKRLAVSSQAALNLKAKIFTVGPPVLLLATFYIFLAATNPGAGLAGPAAGPLAAFALPVNIILVVSTWVLGLLAALNIERATHGNTTLPPRPLVTLYNGILTMTGGFIILDALSSLGTTRLARLPLGVTVALLYAFIAVVGLGFVIVAASGRALLLAQKNG